MEIKMKNEKPFRLAGKSFFLTYPKCELSIAEAADEILNKFTTYKYLMVAVELHEDGEPHLHMLLQTEKKKDIKNPRFFDILGYHGNYQVTRDSDDVRDYCMKGAKYKEYGMYESNNQSKLQKRALQNKILIEKPTSQLVDEGIIALHNYQLIESAKVAYKLATQQIPDELQRKCIWIVGKPGIGKSYYVRKTHPGQFFNKPQNKWWDGYNGQDVVLLDDFDKQGECLGHHLKIWSDNYPFPAEVKGSTIHPLYTKLYVTSNYLPKDIWKPKLGEEQDTELLDAIHRRFEIMTVFDGKLEPYDYI